MALSPTAPLTLAVCTRLGDEVGTATLTPLPPDFAGHRAYLVAVDAPAVRHFCGPTLAATHAGRTLGCLTRVRAGWAVTAYLDRTAFLESGQGWYCPLDVRSRVHGVRIILTYWWVRSRDDRHVADLTDTACRRL